MRLRKTSAIKLCLDNTVGCLIIKIYIVHRNPVTENNHHSLILGQVLLGELATCLEMLECIWSPRTPFGECSV